MTQTQDTIDNPKAILNQVGRPKYFTLVLYKNDAKKRTVTKRIQTKSKNKFSRRLRLIPNEFYALLKVSYSDGGWNDGFYSTKKDLMLAYEAFIEK